MNAISLLIYFVGVVDSVATLSFWLVVPGTIGVFAVLICWIVIGASEADEEYNSKHRKADDRDPPYDPTSYGGTWKWWRKGRNVAFTVAIIGWLFAIFVPSRQTLILIAGSEIGGKVAQSEAVQSVVDPGLELVKTWIASETSKLKSNQETKTNAK